MRGTFIRTLAEIAEHDPRVHLLTGDLGYMALEPFSERFPDRFFNMGVAEQNMVGVATGLAEAGLVPFVYSIVTFATLRPYELIRNGAILHQFPIRIVGVGGGLEYGTNGPSHYGIEDVGVMRVQPGMTVIVPADRDQARTALLSTWDLPGPVYYRIGKDEKTAIPGLDGRFVLGRVQCIGHGNDFLIVTMGNVAREAVEAAALLSERGVDCTVAVVSCVNPAPEDDLASILARFATVMTVEAHYITGGVGSLVSEIIAERGLHCRLVRRGLRSTPNGITGSRDYMHQLYGLSRDALVEAALHEYKASVV